MLEVSSTFPGSQAPPQVGTCTLQQAGHTPPKATPLSKALARHRSTRPCSCRLATLEGGFGANEFIHARPKGISLILGFAVLLSRVG